MKRPKNLQNLSRAIAVFTKAGQKKHRLPRIPSRWYVHKAHENGNEKLEFRAGHMLLTVTFVFPRLPFIVELVGVLNQHRH